MFRRFFLFMVTNLLVIITVSAIVYFVFPALGINPRGYVWLGVYCGIFGMAGAFISLAISRWVAKRAYGIELVDMSSHDSSSRSLYEMVRRLAKRAGLPEIPEVGVYHDNEPNAFATGPSRSKSLVAFSTGLLESMSTEEVEAVAAHEVAHIANGDMVTMTLLTGIANALVMFLARMLTIALDNFLRDDDGGGLGYIGYFIVVMLLETVLMLLAAIPLAAFSRAREYRADVGSAKLNNPGAMISALKRLGSMVDEPTRKDSFAMAKISSSRRVSLWSTHPSIEDRIARLRSM